MRIRSLVVLAGATVALALSATPAVADQPGPGDKQCVPGHQPSPKPGFKAGVCDNP